MTIDRLLRYSTFGWDKLPISQEDSIVHETTIDRLLRYSTFGWDKFPISQKDSIVHETTIDRLLRYSTFGWDKFPISQEDFFIHVATTDRLLQYSTFRWDKFPISKKNYSSMRWPHIDYYGTRPYEDTKPSTIYKKHSSMRQQPVDYHNTRLKLRQNLKKSYSFTRWKLAKRHDLCIHTKRLLRQSSPKKDRTIHYQKVIFTWQGEGTVHPTVLSTLQFGQCWNFKSRY